MSPTIALDHKSDKRRKNEKLKIDQAASRRASPDEDVTRRPLTPSGGDPEPPSTEPKPPEVSSAALKEGSLQSSMPPPTSKSASFDRSQRSQTDKVPKITGAPHPKNSTSNVLPPTVAIYSEPSQGLAQSVKLQSMGSSKATRRVDVPSTEASAPSSSASEVSTGKTIAVERTSRTVNILGDLSSHLDNGYVGSPLDPNMSSIDNPVVLLPAFTDTEGAHDELSLSIPEVASKTVTKSANASKRKRDTDDEPLDELGSDENALGVPKELYQPRPSKRRAGGGDGDIVVPTDFSKRPEAMGKGKRKTKRHKTTAFQELLPKDEDEDEEIKVLPDPRFEIPEKKTPTISTESDQPDVERSGNTEENSRLEDQIEPNQGPKVNGQKKRGRPKKVVTSLSEETVMDETEADHNQDGAETQENVISATAKESRKETKNRETVMQVIDEEDSNSSDAPAARERSQAPLANILNETNGNINPRNLTTDSSPETSPVRTIVTPQTPHKSTTPAPKGPDKHSPISIGKVAYRVGLSKRARIAPLLRILRK